MRHIGIMRKKFVDRIMLSSTSPVSSPRRKTTALDRSSVTFLALIGVSAAKDQQLLTFERGVSSRRPNTLRTVWHSLRTMDGKRPAGGVRFVPAKRA